MAEVSTELAGARKLAAHEQAHRNSLEQRIKALEVCVCVCVCVCAGTQKQPGAAHQSPGGVCVCVCVCRHTETAWSSASKPWRCVCVCAGTQKQPGAAHQSCGGGCVCVHEQARRNSLEQRIKALDVCVCLCCVVIRLGMNVAMKKYVCAWVSS